MTHIPKLVCIAALILAGCSPAITEPPTATATPTPQPTETPTLTPTPMPGEEPPRLFMAAEDVEIEGLRGPYCWRPASAATETPQECVTVDWPMADAVAVSAGEELIFSSEETP